MPRLPQGMEYHLQGKPKNFVVLMCLYDCIMFERNNNDAAGYFNADANGSGNGRGNGNRRSGCLAVGESWMVRQAGKGPHHCIVSSRSLENGAAVGAARPCKVEQARNKRQHGSRAKSRAEAESPPLFEPPPQAAVAEVPLRKFHPQPPATPVPSLPFPSLPWPALPFPSNSLLW